MTIERAFLWFAEGVMLAAFACFVQGFRVRKTDRALHMRLGKLGALLVFAGLIAVEVLLRVFGWKFPIRDLEFWGWSALAWHIAVATVALLLLIALVWTGIRGPRALHVKLYPFFFPLFAATIVLSFVAFELW